MFRTILVPQLGNSADRRSLVAAYEMLRISGGHMDCLYVHDDAAAITSCIQMDAMGVPVVTPELFNTLNEMAKAERSKAEQSCKDYCRTLGIALASEQPIDGAVTATWRAESAHVTTTISASSRYHDVTLLTRLPEQSLSAVDIGAIAIASGRPLFLLPNDWQPRPMDRIAIAWKETPEAARAVTVAMPLIKAAREVCVISVTEDDDSVPATAQAAMGCVRYLKRHGIDAECSQVESRSGGARSALFREAGRRASDLVVMGAYGHSRLRELVLGGFTREVLTSAEIPVLLMH